MEKLNLNNVGTLIGKWGRVCKTKGARPASQGVVADAVADATYLRKTNNEISDQPNQMASKQTNGGYVHAWSRNSFSFIKAGIQRKDREDRENRRGRNRKWATLVKFKEGHFGSVEGLFHKGK